MSVLEEVKYVYVTHKQTKQYTTDHNKKSMDCFYHNGVYFKASMKIMKSVYLKKFVEMKVPELYYISKL